MKMNEPLPQCLNEIDLSILVENLMFTFTDKNARLLHQLVAYAALVYRLQ